MGAPASGGVPHALPDDELLTEQQKFVSACLTGAPSQLPIDALTTHNTGELQQLTHNASAVRFLPPPAFLRGA